MFERYHDGIYQSRQLAHYYDSYTERKNKENPEKKDIKTGHLTKLKLVEMRLTSSIRFCLIILCAY